MDTAVRLARDSKYGFRIVTLDGDIVTPQGAITGGSKKSDATNVFAHERTLKDITAQTENLKSSIESAQTERDGLAVRNEELTKRVREFTEDIHEYELAAAALAAEQTAIRGELNTLTEARSADEQKR